MEHIQVPANLKEQTLGLFDKLVDEKKIFYDRGVSEHVTINGFDYNFIISNILKGKPILPPNAPSRTSPTAKNNPFLNPNPEEIITTLGSSHRLLINKYCVFRPMTVVTTIAYKRQTEDLVESDVHAVWSVLCAFDSDGGGSSSNEGMGQSEAMMIYNCGVGAGSSQGHKHMQVLSLPEGGKSTWPSRAMSTHEVSSHIPNIPFKHHVLLLPALSTATQAYETYLHLLTLAKKDLADYGQEPQCYNVVMTRKWVAVIPRRTAEGPYGGNAAGMVGIVYLPNAEERERWKVEGYGDVLVRFGLPV